MFLLLFDDGRYSEASSTSRIMFSIEASRAFWSRSAPKLSPAKNQTLDLARVEWRGGGGMTEQ